MSNCNDHCENPTPKVQVPPTDVPADGGLGLESEFKSFISDSRDFMRETRAHRQSTDSRLDNLEQANGKIQVAAAASGKES